MKRKLGIVAAFMLVFLAVTGCQKQEEPTKEPEQKQEKASEDLLSGTHHVEIQVKDYGTIAVELDRYSTDYSDQFCQSCKRRGL